MIRQQQTGARAMLVRTIASRSPPEEHSWSPLPHGFSTGMPESQPRETDMADAVPTPKAPGSFQRLLDTHDCLRCHLVIAPDRTACVEVLLNATTTGSSTQG
ncbi:hypothetical protein KIL84_023031 [Mauremys mutica]|uniref:Uncharacterized protein n=1 Tax=Mauremys mutica TaxID=74926 RepID=A0A9D3WP64_9SAUR|nr:hypothetical protein KIL84_023031 [Mauremys mutica]